MSDPVNHPAHYARLKPQPIEVIESWSLDAHRANVLKYIARAGYKDPDKEIEDLQKAQWYLQRKIDMLRKEKEYEETIRTAHSNNGHLDSILRSK